MPENHSSSSTFSSPERALRAQVPSAAVSKRCLCLSELSPATRASWLRPEQAKCAPTSGPLRFSGARSPFRSLLDCHLLSKATLRAEEIPSTPPLVLPVPLSCLVFGIAFIITYFTTYLIVSYLILPPDQRTEI